MISISLQGLDKIDSVLMHLLDARTAQQAANAAAEAYTNDILDWIAEGKSFTPRQGGAGLEGAISWHPFNGGAMVYAYRDYAGYIEDGTGIHAGHQPWTILPTGGRKGLKIPVSGGAGFVIRRAVTHPGSRPFPFFYADREAREAHMGDAVLSLLANKLRGA
jgi:hypothetical protein